MNSVVHRIQIKAGRLYIYYLNEQYGWNDPDKTFIKPLIDGKYNEFPLARIMIIDSNSSKCRLDWQRHNGQWMELKEGNLEECLKFIEDDDWFSQSKQKLFTSFPTFVTTSEGVTITGSCCLLELSTF